MYAADPVSQVVSIADGGREANQLNMRRGTNYGLFPDRPATNIAQVVQLIKDNKAHTSERRWGRVLKVRKALSAFFEKHIAVHFGRHNNDRGTAMFNNITCHQADSINTVHVAQVTIFLIGECFEGCSINDTLIALLCKPDGKLRNERFSCSCRCCYYDRLPLREFSNGLYLK